MRRFFAPLALAALFAIGMVAPVSAADFPNAPQGAHLVQGTPTPSCTVNGLTVSCNSYEIAGVGNTNATATLTATYSEIVDCNNPAEANVNNPVESHTQTFTLSTTSGQIEPKNGRLTIPALSVSPTASDLTGVCPNPLWTAVVREGSPTLTSFTYTVTFAGETAAAITITGP